ncbi:Trp biosynthesis-associated membrane protein [Microbacterium sp.]|uniref:Trp biosynthesis-associated membrane protein n=1 Tax=Microbacterium sp. TaxID=51671 RepID=UPI003F730CD8
MIRRARLLCVVMTLLAGATGIISSTQTWLTVTLADGADHVLLVPGASAIPVLAPLSLAVLALGAALSIAGRFLRYAFGALSVAIAVILGTLTWQVAFDPQASHAASTVTEATGISGAAAVSALVGSIGASPWTVVTLGAWILLLAAGLLTLATAHRWTGSGRKYRTDAAAAAPSASRPHDAIDDWDDLSRGEDPTTRPLD